MAQGLWPPLLPCGCWVVPSQPSFIWSPSPLYPPWSQPSSEESSKPCGQVMLTRWVLYSLFTQTIKTLHMLRPVSASLSLFLPSIYFSVHSLFLFLTICIPKHPFFSVFYYTGKCLWVIITENSFYSYFSLFIHILLLIWYFINFFHTSWLFMKRLCLISLTDWLSWLTYLSFLSCSISVSVIWVSENTL